MTALFVYDGAMNGNVFLALVEQVLSPTLQTGDVVVMDNLPAQQGSRRARRHRALRRQTHVPATL